MAASCKPQEQKEGRVYNVSTNLVDLPCGLQALLHQRVDALQQGVNGGDAAVDVAQAGGGQQQGSDGHKQSLAVAVAQVRVHGLHLVNEGPTLARKAGHKSRRRGGGYLNPDKDNTYFLLNTPNDPTLLSTEQHLVLQIEHTHVNATRRLTSSTLRDDSRDATRNSKVSLQAPPKRRRRQKRTRSAVSSSTARAAPGADGLLTTQHSKRVWEQEKGKMREMGAGAGAVVRVGVNELGDMLRQSNRVGSVLDGKHRVADGVTVPRLLGGQGDLQVQQRRSGVGNDLDSRSSCMRERKHHTKRV